MINPEFIIWKWHHVVRFPLSSAEALLHFSKTVFHYAPPGWGSTPKLRSTFRFTFCTLLREQENRQNQMRRVILALHPKTSEPRFLIYRCLEEKPFLLGLRDTPAITRKIARFLKQTVVLGVQGGSRNWDGLRLPFQPKTKNLQTFAREDGEPCASSIYKLVFSWEIHRWEVATMICRIKMISSFYNTSVEVVFSRNLIVLGSEVTGEAQELYFLQLYPQSDENSWFMRNELCGYV